MLEAIVLVHYESDNGDAKNRLFAVKDIFPRFVCLDVCGKSTDFGKHEVYLSKNDNDLVAYIESTHHTMCRDRGERNIAIFISTHYGIEKSRARVLSSLIKERLKNMKII
jgi:hypothetical protein